MTDISVIVLDVDGGDMLRICLDSIAAQTLPPREVIVFDNGSRTPVAERIAFRPDLHVLRRETNLGFAGGNNEAYRHATGAYVALINNDVALDRDWLVTVAAALDADPKLAAVQTILRRNETTIDGAGIDISDGTFRQAGRGFLSSRVSELLGVVAGLPGCQVAQLFDEPTVVAELSSCQVAPLPDQLPGNSTSQKPNNPQRTYNPATRQPGNPATRQPSNPATQQPSNPPWGVSATAALYRREALGVTIFDARLFAYYEDVDLCARLHESGWRTAVLPVIKATHAGSQSAPLLGGDALRLRTRNRYLVARRHRGVGRIGALLIEDVKLALRGRTSIRGVWQGLFTR